MVALKNYFHILIAAANRQIMKASLALECIQLDESHTPSKKGPPPLRVKMSNIKGVKDVKRRITC
jgi:hypothetical protein